MSDRDDIAAWPAPGLIAGLLRGTRRTCARCGGRGIFRGWFGIVGTCPTCGLEFEREEGYWTGAMMIDIAVTEAIFLVVFIGGMVLTWPEVPWGWLLVVVVAVNIVVPIFYYPIAQAQWIALERHFRALSARGH